MDDPHPEREDGRNIAQQRLNDADRAPAEGKQTLGISNQEQSDRGQQDSDHDQARSDRDYADGGEVATHAWTTAVRDMARRDREETSRARDRTALDRDVVAQRRDELSTLRDQLAEDRDRQATDLDAKDDLADRQTLGVEELRDRGRARRLRAASDRAQAGRDREQAEGDRDQAEGDRHQAEGDRDQAGGDRDQAAYERGHAGTDELTGVRRRGVGLDDLDNEIKRARREGTSLVAAYVDVDGLKSVNDKQGHAAGDTLLRAVVDGFGRHMRPYDLTVRLGGDEFLCVLPNVTLTEAQARFEALRAELKHFEGSSVSFGFSELRDGDSADELVKRADRDLLAARNG